ncbi:hypothetical protein H0H87_008590 [Tephrocybe sp. NHM501043]|nr:hypothetical protein H0H87_008590 [Tephrocybe sp. NHM501043]
MVGAGIWRAPGDAEAELAWLSEDMFNAIITDSFSSLVFVAKNVVRSNLLSKDLLLEGEVTALYTAEDIADHPTLGLETCDFLLITLLASRDYSACLPDCRAEDAVALARVGLGRSPMEDVDRGQDLSDWCEELVAEMMANESLERGLVRFLPTFRPRTRSNFTCALSPLNTAPACRYQPSLVPSRALNLPQIVKLTEAHFVWAGFPDQMYRHFATRIFPGLAMRQLMQAAYAADFGLSRRLCPMVGTVVTIRAASLPRFHPRPRASSQFNH